MKKVKSLADLKRMALAKGAALEVAGDRFNTTQERLHARKEEPPAPEPEEVKEEPAPQPAAQPVAQPAPAPYTGPMPEVVFDRQPVTEQINVHLDMEPLAKAIDSNNERLGELLAESIRQLPVAPQQTKPHSWVFTVKRNVRGFIDSVEATPKP